MPLDKYGRVVVNPSVPVGLPEFAQLYTGQGGSPEEAAARIHMNFPTEAKSRLSEAWSNLGINSSPEQYFSNPLNFQKPTSAVSPISGPTEGGGAGVGFAVTNPLANTWGTFRNESERNMALASGAYDPTYASPLKRSEALSLEAARVRDNETAGSAARAAIPLDPNADDQHILSAQLAGDTRGDTQRTLHSLQGLNYEQAVGMPPGERPQLAPYNPSTGFGGVPDDSALSSKLDTHLLSDPEFQKIAAEDPSRAEHVYKSLTGRAYKGDADLHGKIKGRQAEFGRSLVAKEIADGAYRDEATGAWMVYETREAPEGGPISVGVNAPKPYRQLVKAKPEKQQLMDTYYTTATGQRMPPHAQSTAGQREGARLAEEEPEIAAAIAKGEARMGKSMSPREKMVLAYHMRNRQVADVSGLEHVGNAAATAGQYVGDAATGVGNLFRNYTPTGMAYDWMENNYTRFLPKTGDTESGRSVADLIH